MLLILMNLTFTGRYENSYLSSFHSKYQCNNYVMKIYKLYRIMNGNIELDPDNTYPSYKLWKQIAYDLNMPNMNDKTYYITFKNWFDRTDKKVIQDIASNCPFKRCGALYVNGIHYDKLPNDKESLFWEYDENIDIEDIPRDKDGNLYIIANKIKVLLDPDICDIEAIGDIPF